MANEREAKSFILRYRTMIQSTLPRKLSKSRRKVGTPTRKASELKNKESVPQTDTGDQVE